MVTYRQCSQLRIRGLRSAVGERTQWSIGAAERVAKRSRSATPPPIEDGSPPRLRLSGQLRR
jgi:hypothetical protein